MIRQQSSPTTRVISPLRRSPATATTKSSNPLRTHMRPCRTGRER
ncbi:hypothetical protein HMPREF9552_00814 [Escherichia coli MS 198-1]|nr:hypothetical protein HMPREF9552_00814 [Escherichia coli MS 198-1]ESA80396.1 hypothetical protein HMPREF1599_04931 [Escherichia coli 907713]ESC96455.1 hypothetical protein HMPREF1593_02661 [Escherichia coli 907391]